MGVLTPLATLTADLEKELVMGIERKKELKMLQTPSVNMFMLACTGLPPAKCTERNLSQFPVCYAYLSLLSHQAAPQKFYGADTEQYL